jgi:hypothetical protein
LNLANATVVLSYPYYIIYFFLPLSICLCLIFNLLVKKCWPKEPSTRFFTGALLIQSGVLVCILWLNWHLRVNFSWRSQTVLTVAALTLSVAALVLVEWSRRGARLLVLGLCLALFPLAVQSFKYTNYGRTLWIARVGGMREQYWVIKRAIRFISEETRGAFPNFWISPSANQEVATGLFRSYNRCGFLPGFPVKLPDPEVQWQHKLVPGEFLVIVTAVGQPLDPGRKLLLQHGLNFERVGSKKFVQGGFSIAVHVVKLIRGA